MNRSTRRRCAATAAALAVVCMAGCSSPAPTSSTVRPTATSADALPTAQPVPTGRSGGTPRGGALGVNDVDGMSADAVATAFAATAYRYDVRLDRSPMDASRRATPLLSANYAAAVEAPLPGSGGADWLELVKHDGFTTTTVAVGHDDGALPDDKTHADRQRTVTVTTHGASGWSRAPRTETVYVQLVRTGPAAPWRVDGITTS